MATITGFSEERATIFGGYADAAFDCIFSNLQMNELRFRFFAAHLVPGSL